MGENGAAAFVSSRARSWVSGSRSNIASDLKNAFGSVASNETVRGLRKRISDFDGRTSNLFSQYGRDSSLKEASNKNWREDGSYNSAQNNAPTHGANPQGFGASSQNNKKKFQSNESDYNDSYY